MVVPDIACVRGCDALLRPEHLTVLSTLEPVYLRTKAGAAVRGTTQRAQFAFTNRADWRGHDNGRHAPIVARLETRNRLETAEWWDLGVTYRVSPACRASQQRIGLSG